MIIGAQFAGYVVDQSRGHETPFIARFAYRVLGSMVPSFELTDHEVQGLHQDLLKVGTPRAQALARTLSETYQVRH